MTQQRQQQEERAKSMLYARAVGDEHSPAPPRPDYAARRTAFMASRRRHPPHPRLHRPNNRVLQAQGCGPICDAFFAGRRKQRGPEVGRREAPQTEPKRATGGTGGLAARPSREGKQAFQTQEPGSKRAPAISQLETRRRDFIERPRTEQQLADAGPGLDDDSGPPWSASALPSV